MAGSVALVTIVHVLISLMAMGAGFVVVGGFLNGRAGSLASLLFLGMTGLTSVTGFLFPWNGITPAAGVGVVSLVVFVPTCYALRRGLAGRWRSVYVLGTMLLLYFNVFVLVAQLFLKVPAMRELAPTQREAPFLIVQLAVAGSFVVLALRAHACVVQTPARHVR